MPPVIAIAPSRKPHDYEQSLLRAFAEARTLDRHKDRPADVASSVDGVLLCGGGDLHPGLYGEEAHTTFDPAEEGRDEWEMDLVRQTIRADIPLLAICRGIQVLNVAMGGTLLQDIPPHVSGPLPHSVPDLPTHIAHELWVMSDTLLFRLMEEKMEE